MWLAKEACCRFARLGQGAQAQLSVQLGIRQSVVIAKRQDEYTSHQQTRNQNKRAAKARFDWLGVRPLAQGVLSFVLGLVLLVLSNKLAPFKVLQRHVVSGIRRMDGSKER